MILQRYVFRELALHFLFTLVAVTGIFAVGLGVQSLYRFSELPLVVVVKSFPFFVPYSFAYTVPMALLVAVVLTYGRLAQDREILAVRTSGVHLYPLIAPAIFVGLLLSLASFWVNDRVIPYCNAKKRDITRQALEQIVADINSGQGRSLSVPLLNLSWESVEQDGTIVKPLLVLKNAKLETEGKLMAERGRIRLLADADAIQFHFEEGRTIARQEKKPKPGEVRANGAEPEPEVYHLPLTFEEFDHLIYLDDLFQTAKKPQDRKLSELIHSARIRRNPSASLELKVEVHRRLALSFACLVFALVGAPLGVLFRRGGKLAALFVSFLVVMFVFYPLLTLGQALAEEGTVPAFVGLWLPDVTVGGIGIALLLRVFRQ